MEQLVNFIIRPPRAEYNPKHDLLDDKFMLKGRWFQRKDLKIKNGKGLVLECSHYLPLTLEGKAFPCVIYCHGNSGCRSDASEAAIILLPSNITVFTLDFSGSGLSQGEHVTLGWNEKEDLRSVVNHLREDQNVSCIGLWGRSMGAVTSLLYGAEDPSIAGMVLDSPFSNLVDLMMELVDTYKYPLPKFTVKLAIQHMRRVIKKKAAFDIMDLDTIQVAKHSFVPALFGHAMDDDFIRPHHADRIYDSYVGDKNIIKFEGDHNSFRPQFYFDSITIFFHNVLDPPTDAFDEDRYHSLQGYFDESAWAATRGIDRINDPPSSSTEHAINQVRMRRPMSRMEVPSDVSQGKWHEAEENATSDLHPSSSTLATPRPCNTASDLTSPNVAEDLLSDYIIDNFPETPCSIDDEERMLMHAIMESLKDMEIATAPAEEQFPNVDATSSKASIGKASNPDLDCISTSASNTVFVAPELESKSATSSRSARNEAPDHGRDVQQSVNDDSVTSSLVVDLEERDGTSARVVVQKNPGQVQGFVQRWGNFFRNNA